MYDILYLFIYSILDIFTMLFLSTLPHYVLESYILYIHEL